jgi:diacylglycerol kinase family enzyme
VSEHQGGTRSAVVVNPVKVVDLAGHRRTIRDVLGAHGWPEPVWLETTPEDPGAGQARRAVEDGAEVVFVCGGDGTVMSCVTALAGTDAAMAIIPSGTGNLLAANLGLEGDVTASVLVAVERGRRQIDVGEVVGEDGGRCFAVMAGMGFDAAMLRDTSEKTKQRIGWPAYFFGAARNLRDRPMRLAIKADGGPVRLRRARSVLVANVGRLQGGMKLLADAEPDDGLLDVAVLTPRTLRHWAALGWAVIRRQQRVPRLETFRAAEVEILSTRPQPRELDGDVIEPSRALRVRVRPKALWLCVPQPEQAADIAYDADHVGDRR